MRPALALQVEVQQVPEVVNLASADKDKALGEAVEAKVEDDQSGDGVQDKGILDNCLGDPSRSKWNITTKRMGKLKDSMFVQQPPKPITEGNFTTLKVAFLLFVKDRVSNPKLWKQWMADARHSGLNFNLMIHAYGINRPYGIYNASEFRQKEFRKYMSPTWSWSNWCMMWDAEFMVFKHALKDPNVTHVMVLSQDSVPLKPMRYIYRALEADPVTRMCADDYVYKPWPRAETWWVMRRGDADLFTQFEDQARQQFRAECSEEEAWYYPLRARMERWGYDAAPVKNECVMFTDWADGKEACKTWADMVKQCPNNCRVTRSMNKTESATKHPVIFHSLSSAAYRELMASPFWFARKVDEEALVTPRRFAAMLEAYDANHTDPAEGYEENLSIPEELEDLPDPPEEPDPEPPRRRSWWSRLLRRHQH